MQFEATVHPSAILSTLRGLGRWWGGELRSIWSDVAPIRWGAPRWIIDTGRDTARILDRKGRVAGGLAEGGGRSAAEAVIDKLGELRPGTPVILRLPHADCFVRNLELPAAARDGFPQLLRFQLERLTPFKLSDVNEAHWIKGPGERPGMLSVRHVVVRRKRVDELMERCARAGLRVAHVDCWDENDTASMPVDLLAASRPARPKRIPRFLATLAALGASAAFVLDVTNHETAITRVTAETAALRQSLHQIQAATSSRTALVGHVERVLTARKQQPSATEVLDEISSLLPDTTVLQHFRVERGTLEISGFSESAVALLPLLEQSRLFHDARLTAPVSRDSKDARERFGIRLQIKSLLPSAAALATEAN